ncbi:MAG: D-2-hydroxyacid dehydrogenase [Thermomicrobiales bacterium]
MRKGSLVPEQEAERIVVVFTSPLESMHVDRIAAVAPDRVELIFRPDLLPPARYTADHTGPAGWRRDPDAEAEWRALLRRAEVTWDFAQTPTESPLDLSPGLKWVQTTSAGVGQYVKRLGLQESGLIVTTSSGVHAEPLTEFVFAALLHHTKRIAMLQEWQRQRHWERYAAGGLPGRTMAIVGPGRIGRQVAKIANAFGMTTWAMARTNDAERADELGVDRLFGRGELDEMLGGADCVVLCMPHTPETDGSIGAARIAAMKPGVTLVNIARGAVIDEQAMIAALASGQIGFAALDVFQTEPLPADSPLWAMDNVLVNPHSASTADTENAKITDIFVHNLRAFVDGRLDQMTPVLDKQRMY